MFTLRKLFYVFICCLYLIITSCANTREVTYFNDIQDSEFNSRFEDMEPVIRKNDLLSISVSSLNPEAASMFNLSNASISQAYSASGTVSQATGYLVDQGGYIRFPFLGKIKAEGKSKSALRDEITQELIDRKLLLEPIVDIRYLNYRVSVMGEVGNPSVLTIPSEKVTFLEALSLAGDLTIYAKRDNVLLIREEYGLKKLRRIDLTSEDIFTSPYYYLKSNDIIYVEPNKSKIASTSRTSQWLPVILSALSLVVISIATFLN